MQRDVSLIPLSHQHHNGLALCVLTERALRADRGPDTITTLARKIIDRYEIELVNHFEIEEHVLFPALGDLPLVNQLVAEHRQMESMIEPLRTQPAEDTIRQFTELLRRHIRREENELFEEAQRRLSRETLDAIGHQIDERAVRVCL